MGKAPSERPDTPSAWGDSPSEGKKQDGRIGTFGSGRKIVPEEHCRAAGRTGRGPAGLGHRRSTQGDVDAGGGRVAAELRAPTYGRLEASRTSGAGSWPGAGRRKSLLAGSRETSFTASFTAATCCAWLWLKPSLRSHQLLWNQRGATGVRS
jgi:hypothetical protein